MTVSIENKPITKKIWDLKWNQAFKYGDYWYIKVNIKDNEIHPYDEFFDEHVIKNGINENAENYDDYIPCLYISSHTFCYLRKDIEVSEYGTPTMSVALYQ